MRAEALLEYQRSSGSWQHPAQLEQRCNDIARLHDKQLPHMLRDDEGNGVVSALCLADGIGEYTFWEALEAKRTSDPVLWKCHMRLYGSDTPSTLP